MLRIALIVFFIVIGVATYAYGFHWLVVSTDESDRKQADQYVADCEKQGGDVRVFGSDEACIIDGAKVYEWYRP